MNRFDCMQRLGALLKDELVILSLGASVDEWYNAAPHMRDASLFHALDLDGNGALTRLETQGDLDLGPRFDDMDINRDGIVTTIPVGPIELSTGRLPFDPGGLGLALVDLRRDLAVGETFDLELVFATAGALTVTVGVEASDARQSSEDH